MSNDSNATSPSPDAGSQLIHDLRTNLHAIEVAITIFEGGPGAEQQSAVLDLLKKELDLAKANLEALVLMVRSRVI